MGLGKQHFIRNTCNFFLEILYNMMSLHFNWLIRRREKRLYCKHIIFRSVHHSYCHINLVKKTMYQWDIEKVGIYILYLPSDIHVQKYFEEPKKIFHLIFSFNSISKSRTTSNYIIRKLFSLWNTSQLVNCRINDKLACILVLQFYLKQFTTWNLQN